MYLGVDIGSSSSKCALLDDDKNILSVSVVNQGTGTDAYKEALRMVLQRANKSKEDIEYTVATGYGRVGFKDANRQVTEITCHSKGVDFLVPQTRLIIDIGGQDAKVIKLDEEGKVINFVMNEKCAAGTGRFLEVMARVLGCSICELSDLAAKHTKEISISNVCTVFAESEVISRLASGEALENVARGAHIAIAKRIKGLAERVGYNSQITMTGGVALNKDLIEVLTKEMNCEITASPYCQEAGAVGAAIIAYEMCHKGGKKDE